MKEYLQTTDAVLDKVGSSGTGLTGAEAAARLEKNGKNKLAEGKRESVILRFLKQLIEPMTIILLVAAAISAVLAVYEGSFPSDVVIIMAVVVINAVLGVVQESKAEEAIAALQEMSAATSKVLRDGKQVSVHSEDLVVGDVIILEAGDAVPADARLLECASMKVEEAALTGESVPVVKTAESLSAGESGDVPLGDRINMVFMGSTVVYGRGKAVITATGMGTEMGKIASALSQAEEGKTPLQIKLSQLSRILTYLVVGICVVIFAVNLAGSLITNGSGNLPETILNTFMIAVSLAVAAIPEGLSTVVTIVLSIGVTNMSKKNAIIRKLTAVETLGCTQIICSDKTGTLTQNKMTVVDHVGEDESLLANAMSLCSDAEFDAGEGAAVGEPTECALVNYAAKLGLDKNTYSISIPLGATINMGGAAITISIMALAAAHTLGISVDFPTALILCILAAASAAGASGVAGGSLLLIPMACSLFGIPNDVAMQVVGVGFIVGVIQDSCETALNSSTDVLYTACACRIRKNK